MFVCLKTSQVKTLVLGLFNKQAKPKHKKFKPISTLPHSIGPKSRLISTLSPLRGRENLRRPKWGEAKQNCRPYLHMRPTFYLFIYLWEESVVFLICGIIPLFFKPNAFKITPSILIRWHLSRWWNYLVRLTDYTLLLHKGIPTCGSHTWNLHFLQIWLDLSYLFTSLILFFFFFFFANYSINTIKYIINFVIKWLSGVKWNTLCHCTFIL